MAQFARVSRDVLYANMPSPTPNSVPTQDHAPETSANAKTDTEMYALTWQQKQAFGALDARTSYQRTGSKQRKWQPLDLEGGPKAAETSAGENAWGDPIVSIGDAGVVLARAPVPSWFDNPETPKPATDLPPTPKQPLGTNKPPPNPHPTQRKSRGSRSKPPPSMAPSKEAKLRMYIPPHMRKRPTAEPEPEVEAGHGITGAVGEGKASTSNSTYPLQQVSSAQDEPTKPSDHRPHMPSSPSSPPEETGITLVVWDDPKPEPVSMPRKNNPRWPRNIPRKRQWPRASEMRPRAEDEEADCGVDFKSESNGDPDYDVKKLIDWNGDWLPPPVDWASRKCFTHRHFGTHIEEWINGHDRDFIAVDISSPDFLGRPIKGEYVVTEGRNRGPKCINYEIAPRAWIPTQIDGESPKQFWRGLKGRSPVSFEDDDLAESQPWWDLYSASGAMLMPVQVPEARIDKDDPDNSGVNVGLSTNEYLQWKETISAERLRRKLAKRNRPPVESKPPPDYEPQPDRRLSPTANIYLRPVRPQDASEISNLYNYYVRETIFANEFDDRSSAHMLSRINATKNAELPFIVAVDSGSHWNAQGSDERIVGYCSLDDYCDRGSMYRFAFELDLYIHHEYLRKGIAKCLLDKMLELADTSYNARLGYRWIKHFEYLRWGPARRIKTINVTVAHESGAGMEWMNGLLRDFGFVKAGHLKTVGHKKGKVVDVSIWQRHTSEDVNPEDRPVA